MAGFCKHFLDPATGSCGWMTEDYQAIRRVFTAQDLKPSQQAVWRVSFSVSGAATLKAFLFFIVSPHKSLVSERDDPRPHPSNRRQKNQFRGPLPGLSATTCILLNKPAPRSSVHIQIPKPNCTILVSRGCEVTVLRNSHAFNRVRITFARFSLYAPK